MWSKTHVSFENHERQLKIPFIIYAHFDSLQIPHTKTKSKILHKPCGFSYSVKCSYDSSLTKYEDYIGEDSPRVFWTKLEEEMTEIVQKLRTKVEPVLNNEEKRLFEKIQDCYFCSKKLVDERYADFHPLTGQFLGAAHKQCVTKTKIPNYIPVVIDNFRKYGSHFLLKELSKTEMESVFLVGKDQGFARNFSIATLRFIDLRQFMDEKIEDLEEILSDGKKRRLNKEFRTRAVFELVKKKMYFPYYYMDSFKKFEDTNLPSESGFFDQLHDEKIFAETYQRSLKIWTCFECKSIGDYFKVYLKCSVFLLEDIFENFRSLCLDKYHLDPAHYFTIASFSWDSMMRHTRVSLELLKDKNMINFIKFNIRGGITQCSKRHAKANNKYCNYDNRKPSTFIAYLDANNLGGWAMSQKLPFSDFTWLSKSEIQMIQEQICILDEDGDYGYFCEVDLDYPQRLHKLHNDLPFCSQPLAVPPPPTSPILTAEKSVLNLYNKRKYVIEYRTLKQCLENGLILKKIHRVLRFKQCAWLEPYMTYNTTLRARAENDFEIKLYKLLNNSVYGKTIQKTGTDKPLYAGFSILELSKKFMYDFHYKFMLPKYKNKINLLYVDTDGVIYEIQTADYFQDIITDPKFLSLMDTSNLDKRWGIPQRNRKVVGKMKDEYDGKIIREFFGLGAKKYFLDVDGEEVKKGAGIKKYVKAKYLNRQDYENSVLKGRRVSRSYFETESEAHQVVSKKTSMTVLSPGDRKRFVLLDKVNTLAWGFEAE